MTSRLTLGIACKILSRLGGALNRNAREPSGAETIMRGLVLFRAMLTGYRLGATETRPFFSG
mgnify:CR=1 FL=1